jgi:hypothetical protein
MQMAQYREEMSSPLTGTLGAGERAELRDCTTQQVALRETVSVLEADYMTIASR